MRAPTSQRPAVAILASGACALLAVGVATRAGAPGALALGLAALAAVATVRLPLRWWPSVLLLVTVAAPANLLPVPGFRGLNGSVSPTLLLVPLWLVAEVRAGWRGRPRAGAGRRAVQVLGALLVAVLALETALSPDLRTSGGWAVNLVVMTVLVPLVLRGDGADLLVRTWVAAGGALGAYAVLEVALGTSPLWGWAGGGGARASASFGNPLPASSFFAAATVLGMVRWVERPTRGGAVLLAGAAAGVAATGSRGALVAAAVGLVVVVAVVAVRTVRRDPAVRRTAPALVAVLLAFVAVVVLGLGQRSGDDAVEGSNVVRERSLQTGLFIAGQTNLLGQGPGRAFTVKTTTAGPGTDEGRSIENAWIELYVGVGPVGCAAFAAFVLGCLALGVRHRAWDGVAVVLALLVAYLLYNALEGGKPMTMLLLGAGLGLCLLPPGGEESAPSTPAGGQVGAAR